MDPYGRRLLREERIFYKKSGVLGKLVAIMDLKDEKRGLQLINPWTRAMLKNGVHELIITDEGEAVPGKKVDSVAYLGFVEVEKGGVVMVGDEVLIKGRVIGRIAEFDETHMPNHLNIVIGSERKATGVTLNARLGDEVVIG